MYHLTERRSETALMSCLSLLSPQFATRKQHSPNGTELFTAEVLRFLEEAR